MSWHRWHPISATDHHLAQIEQAADEIGRQAAEATAT